MRDMARGPEAKVQDAVVRYARSVGCKAYKFESPGNSGVPDFLFSHINSGPFFMEFKAPGAKPRPLQEIRQSEMADAGCVVFGCVSSVQIGKEIVDDMVNRAKLRHLPVPGL